MFDHLPHTVACGCKCVLLPLTVGYIILIELTPVANQLHSHTTHSICLCVFFQSVSVSELMYNFFDRTCHERFLSFSRLAFIAFLASCCCCFCFLRLRQACTARSLSSSIILCRAMEGLFVEVTAWPRRELRSSFLGSFQRTEEEKGRHAMKLWQNLQHAGMDRMDKTAVWLTGDLT